LSVSVATPRRILRVLCGFGSTLATYETLSEPTVTLPAFIVKLAQQKTLPEMPEQLRRETQ
jgi:hypothetical protein